MSATVSLLVFNWTGMHQIFANDSKEIQNILELKRHLSKPVKNLDEDNDHEEKSNNDGESVGINHSQIRHLFLDALPTQEC